MANEIECSNNGVRDSLTGVMAPELFYENCARTIAVAEREGTSLFGMAISLDFKEGESINKMSEEIIGMAATLNEQLRAGDLLCRIGERIFVLLIRGDIEVEKSIYSRIAASTVTNFTYLAEEHISGSSIQELLSSLRV